MNLLFFEPKPRKRRFIHSLVVSMVILAFCLVAQAAEKTIILPLETATLKPGPGVAEASMCMTCHSVDYISIQPRFKRTVWKAEVIKMQQKYAAPIPTNMVDRIVEYLTVNYGQEDPAINAAPIK